MRIARSVRILLSLFFLGSLSVSAGERTDAFVLAVERVKHSVIPVLCGKFTLGQFSLQLIDGTGFFVDEDGDFVTAAHVIKDLKTTTLERPIPCVMAIYVPDSAWEREAVNFQAHWFLFKECKVDAVLDLAVCKTTDKIPAKITPVVIEDIRPADGSAVAFTGFPLGTVEPISSLCDIATYHSAIDGEGSREFVLDKGTWPGASGSPVYDNRGVVIGIMLARGLADSVGTSFGRPSHFILTFLRENGISLKTGTDKPKKHKK